MPVRWMTRWGRAPWRGWTPRPPTRCRISPGTHAGSMTISWACLSRGAEIISKPSSSGPRVLSPLLMLVGLTLVALNLRPAVTSVGPLLQEIVQSLGFDRIEAGILTTLPVLCFGLIGPVAPAFGRRFGAENVIFAALIAVAIACAMRLAPSALALYASSIL